MRFDKTETYLIAGCMLSNLIVLFQKDGETGDLKEIARLEVEKGIKVTDFLWVDE
jgi:6-phosphogluconolactonase (cycloisomerase 2 family)